MSELPPGWEWATVGEVTSAISKVDPRAEPEALFDYIDIGGVDGDRGVIVETQRLPGGEAPSRARQVVRAGDTLLSTVRTYMRKTALVPDELDGQVASTGFSVLRPQSGVEPRYLYHAVRRPGFVDPLSGLQTGSSYPAVRDRDVRSMPLPLAPIREQERIVAAIEEHLSRLDAAEASVRSTGSAIDALRKSTISGALGRDAWPIVSWGEVGHTLSGRAFPSSAYGDDGVLLVRPGNLAKSGHVEWSDRSTTYLPTSFATEFPKYRLSGQHLLMNLTAQSLADDFLGRVCLSDVHDEFMLNQRIAKLSSGLASDDYLHWVFRSGSFRRYVAGLNTGSLIQHISTKQLASFSFPLPPEDEQARLANEIEAAVDTIDRLESNVIAIPTRARALRRSILGAAFSGQLVPQDPEDELASVLLERIRAEQATATPAKRARSAAAS